MTRVLYALCFAFAISVLVDAAMNGAGFFHDYVKDGRSNDGPFPGLKNAPYYCYQPPSKGPCGRMFVVYFYDIVRRHCMPMLYSGCGGNENRFDSKASCQIHCETKRPI